MNDYFETPICPNCGHTIVEDKTTVEYYNVDSIDFIISGTCPNCGKSYHWTYHYARDYNCDLEEDMED